MIERIGNGSSLAQAALESALRAHQEAAARVESQVAPALAPAPASGADFQGSLVGALQEGLRAVDGGVQAVERLPQEMLAGEVGDFHEIAARLKSSELTFKFALEVRNKLIEAYRETMRMSV